MLCHILVFESVNHINQLNSNVFQTEVAVIRLAFQLSHH